MLIEDKVRLIFSEELVEELRATFEKPKLKKYFPENPLDEMLEIFDSYSLGQDWFSKAIFKNKMEWRFC